MCGQEKTFGSKGFLLSCCPQTDVQFYVCRLNAEKFVHRWKNMKIFADSNAEKHYGLLVVKIKKNETLCFTALPFFIKRTLKKVRPTLGGQVAYKFCNFWTSRSLFLVKCARQFLLFLQRVDHSDIVSSARD